MPSYNTPQEFLEESIFSILVQTYHNFEFIIIDDGSDNSIRDVVNNFSDSRIHFYENEGNQGLAFTLNRGISIAKGKYIARMDSDDICYADRIKKQVNYLETHKDIDVLGTYARCFGAKKIKYTGPGNNADIKACLLFSNPIVHPTVMMRRSIFLEVDVRYSSEYISEDYNFWIDAALKYHLKFHTLKQALLLYRMHRNQLTMQKEDEIRAGDLELLVKLFDILAIHLSNQDRNLYFKFKNKEQLTKLEYVNLVVILKYILNRLNKNPYFDVAPLKKKFVKEYLKQCIKSKHYGCVSLLHSISRWKRKGDY